jgi:inosose dehydratase
MTLFDEWKDLLGHHMMTWNGYWRKHEREGSLETYFRELREAGFGWAEIGANPFGKSAAEVADLAAEYNVRIAAIGTAVTATAHPPNTEAYQKAMDFAQELGVKTLAVCGGFIPGKRRTTFETDYELFGRNLAGAMAYAENLGLTFTYHPHLACMVETLEEIERLLQYVPELDLCVDSGHLIGAGTDPIDVLTQYPQKIKHVHLKDFDREKEAFTEIGDGSGEQDFPGFFRKLTEIGYNRPVIIERDSSPFPGQESAGKSLAGVKRLLG